VTTLSQLNIRIAADISQFQSAMGRIPGAVNSGLERVQRVAGLTARALGAIGAVGGTALVGFLRQSAEADDAAGKLAQKIGISTEQLTRYQYAAELADVSTEQFGAAMIKLGSNTDKAAAGQKQLAEQFARLGIEVKTAEGKVRPVSAVFEEVLDKLSRLPDGATKSRIAIALFGRAGADLIPLLNGGTRELEQLGDEAERFGVVIRDDAAAAGEQLNDNLTRLDKIAEGLQRTIGNALLTPIAALADEFVRATREGEGLFRVLTAIPTAVSRVASGTDTQQLGKLENQLLGLEKTAQRVRDARGDPAALALLEERIAVVRAQIKGLQTVLQPSQLGLRGGAGAPVIAPSINENDPALSPVDQAAVTRQARAAERARQSAATARQAAIDAEAGYIQRLEQALALEHDSSEAARVRFDLINGEAKSFSAAGRTRIEQLAHEIDLQRESAEVQKELLDIAAKRESDALAKAEAVAQERAQTIEALRTPVERYADEVRRLSLLDLGQENLQRGIAGARVELERAQEVTEKTNDVARELGLTFSSAFEDAVVAGNSFSDVLSGIEKDLIRLGTRKLVTEPLTNKLGDLFEGGGSGGGGIFSVFSKLFSALPGFATGGSFIVGGSGGIDSQVVAFRATPGEPVDVGMRRAVVVNLNYANPPRTPFEAQSAQQQAAAAGVAVRKALTRNT
jgi:hypothetical protein